MVVLVVQWILEVIEILVLVNIFFIQCFCVKFRLQNIVKQKSVSVDFNCIIVDLRKEIGYFIMLGYGLLFFVELVGEFQVS